MKIIKASCVDDALFQGINLLLTEGQRSPSRNGEVAVISSPVMTVNENPMRRVLFSPQRDANPFFHLNEALWMLAGRNDITWLDQFVGNFSERFGEKYHDGEMYQHGAYGYRWREHFDMEGGGEVGRLPDQLTTIVNMLKTNPDERRAVLAMWDPVADLAQNKKDIPCNTHIYLRIRGDRGDRDLGHGNVVDYDDRVLDLTVCCRSNDAIWGAHGANAVHFSILQEYLAARIGVGMGKLYQMSNNYHGYLDKMQPLIPYSEFPDHYQIGHVVSTQIVTHPGHFDHDLWIYFSDMWDCSQYTNKFFEDVAIPLRVSYALWRKKARARAKEALIGAGVTRGRDWLIAANQWFDRRLNATQKTIQLEGDQNVG
jgi:thymidylate synthase